MINKIILKTNDFEKCSSFKEFVELTNDNDQKSHSFVDISQVDIMFFGVKFSFKNSFGSLSLMSSDSDLIIRPCDGNNINITTGGIIHQLYSVEQKDKLATFKDLSVSRFGKQRKTDFNAEQIIIEIDDLTFEITCFNDGNLRVSSVEHSHIKIEPSSKNVILITSND